MGDGGRAFIECVHAQFGPSHDGLFFARVVGTRLSPALYICAALDCGFGPDSFCVMGPGRGAWLAFDPLGGVSSALCRPRKREGALRSVGFFYTLNRVGLLNIVICINLSMRSGRQ